MHDVKLTFSKQTQSCGKQRRWCGPQSFPMLPQHLVCRCMKCQGFPPSQDSSLNTFPPLLTQINHLLHRAMRAVMTCRGKRPSLPSNLSGCQVFLCKLLEAFSFLSRNARCGKQAVERSTSPASEKLQGKLPTAPTTQTLQERQTYAYL